MVKLFNVYYPKRTLQLLVVESTLIILALVGSVFVHFRSEPLAIFRSEIGLFKIALVAGVCVFFLYYNNLYSPGVVRDPRKILARFMQGLGIAAVVLALAYYLVPGLQLYRGFAVTGISFAAVLLISNRAVFSAASRSTEPKKNVIILGEGAMARLLAKVIQERTELGLSLIGYLGNEWRSETSTETPAHLGGLHDLLAVARESDVSRVIVAMGDQRGKLPVDDLLVLKTSGVAVQDAAEFYEIATGKLPVGAIRLSWLIFSPGFQVSGMTLFYKRLISVILAFFGLLLLSPVILLIALAIRLDSPGPIIFRQRRIGFRGQPFTLFKFRTMCTDADGGGYARPAQHNDVRITRVGRWLRRFRLDEIPQLYNILVGQMHFVGPRPFVSEQELDCAAQIPLYSYRWSVRPGATGWAQVQRGYCASLEDNIDKLSYDLFYIKNMSVGLDLLIIFKTIKIVLTAQGGR
jgi:sugar transferase (PEP-CTERM system associated)